MKPDKKPRADSKLDSMPESRVMELRDKIMAGDTYQECLAWLSMECHVDSTLSALSSFYKRHCWPIIRERRQISVIKAEALGDAMAKDPVNWDDKIIDRTKQLVFEFLSTDGRDPDAVSSLLDSIIKAKKQEFSEQIQTRKANAEERKLVMLEAKAAQADAAAGVTNNHKLTPEEKAAELKRIFRMG
jgi:hypothetical protein